MDAKNELNSELISAISGKIESFYIDIQTKYRKKLPVAQKFVLENLFEELNRLKEEAFLLAKS